LKKNLTFLAGFFISLFLLSVSVSKAEAASFYFEPSKVEKVKQEEFEVKLRLDTGGEEVSGVDIILEFDKDFLEVKQVDFNNLFPLNDAQIKNDEGSLKIYSTVNSVGTAFNDNDRLATIKLKGLKAGQGEVGFKCSLGETGDDTNIWKKGGGDIVDCSSLLGFKFIIKEGCETPKPPENVKAVSGPGAGQITLSWDKSLGARYYNITYGPSSLNYEWGAPNIGDVDTYAVSGLTPGSPYYFIVSAVNDCGSSGALYEVAAYAGKGGAESDYWQGPEVVDYVSDTATFSAEATTSASPSLRPSPTVLPQEEEEGEGLLKGISNGISSIAQKTGDVLTSSWLKWVVLILAVLIILALAGKKLVEKDIGGKQEKLESEEEKFQDDVNWPPPPVSSSETVIPEERTDTSDIKKTEGEGQLASEKFSEASQVKPEEKLTPKPAADVSDKSFALKKEGLEDKTSNNVEVQPDQAKEQTADGSQKSREPEWIKNLKNRQNQEDKTNTQDQQ
jgi:hypothetical protein